MRPLGCTGLLSIFTLSQILSSALAEIYFCKCMCFSNYTIVPIYRPKDPAKPCLSCTKQFCLDQKLAICQNAKLGNTNLDTGTGEEGDVRTKCFQRDSAKDQVVSMEEVGSKLFNFGSPEVGAIAPFIMSWEADEAPQYVSAFASFQKSPSVSEKLGFDDSIFRLDLENKWKLKRNQFQLNIPRHENWLR
ncbi:hypothetical protein O181_063400 [Austropuccinia psidii MF-1]|uniref:Uncharacterized protein n=1 Tax=Austropuccinia psidii MF-1 TaxID=1389203 RepID=A0A9Q3ER74_9BASI|nr:hypothetical protein [Austropuccinia psidii MF-1]